MSPNNPISVVIMAAGLGKRMNSDSPKVLALLGGRPLIQHVLKTAAKLNPQKIIVIVGHKAEEVKSAVVAGASSGLYDGKIVEFAFQKELRGTGDAVRSALEVFPGFIGEILILSGDVPLVREKTLLEFIKFHTNKNATISIVSNQLEEPQQYGRVIRKSSGEVQRIVEFKDCSPEQVMVKEINTGVYLVDSAFLYPAIKELNNNNAQAEYYLTDIIEAAIKQGQNVAAMIAKDFTEFLGINTRKELMATNKIARLRKLEELVHKGVNIEDVDTVYLDEAVEVEPGAYIGPMCILKGKTVVKSGVTLEGNCYIDGCTIETGAHIKIGVRMERSHVGPNCSVGPFANLREGSRLEADVKIGNFVEIKKAHFGEGAKASHLSYIGDAEVGAEANIGAGTITCNYDGFKKSQTKIGSGAFIGSNSVLIAPVEVGDGAYVAAGSAISKNVSKDALAITRADLRVKEGWAKARREKAQK